MAEINFSRTTSGKINKAFFVGEVVVYVEGDDDFAFFASLRRSLGFRVESSNGKHELVKLAQRVSHDHLPYVVVMDDDFDVIAGRSFESDQVVYVGRYSIENLLACDSVIKELVCDYCGIDCDLPSDGSINQLWVDLGSKLAMVAVADLAADLAGIDRGGVPDRIEMWLQQERGKLTIRRDAWADFEAYLGQLGEARLDQAKHMLDGLSEAEVCRCHLRGHLVFGLIRNRIVAAIKAKNGRINIDSRGLLMLCADIFWRLGSECAINLRERLFSAKASAAATLV